MKRITAPTQKIKQRGRKRKYATDAERRQAYILRHQIDENARKRESAHRNSTNDISRLLEWKIQHPEHKYDRSKTRENAKISRKAISRQKRMNTPFIAFDGEGVTTNVIQGYLKSDSEDSNGMPVYRQLYVLLTASDGGYIENWKTGLTTVECLDFLLSYSGQNYLIGFGIGYDVTKILHELTAIEIAKLWKKKWVIWQDYNIEYIANKIFRVTKDGRSVTLYDTHAFFGKSFVNALTDWKIEIPVEIIKGKADRQNFSTKDRNAIKKYNLMECKLLVELMNKLRFAMNVIDAVPYQWYGVGALSQLIMTQNDVKRHIDTPIKMKPHFLEAYYGGRNQVLKIGEFDTDIFLHDINSAYPDAMTELPSSIGAWSETAAKFYDYSYALYKLEWNLPLDVIITPFPVRSKGNIYYPLKGTGTYWQPEVAAAMKYYRQYITIKKVWFFEPIEPDVRPFGFYRDYYKQRQEFLKQGNDAQLVLKLALNAGYGKLAQSIGGHISIDSVSGQAVYNLPPFQNYFWAGMITSKCRAKVFELAMSCSDSVISFATDGVAATKQLIEHSVTKDLGCWEVKPVKNYFIAQTGVYTYRDADVEKFKTRGFGYKSIDYSELRKQWQTTGIYTSFSYNENRFIGIGNGLQRNQPELIGCWIDCRRSLDFFPKSMRVSDEADNHIVQLRPPFDMGESEPYKMKSTWLESAQDRDAQDDLDQIKQ